MIRFVSLFTGIGGIELGLERAGLESYWQQQENAEAGKSTDSFSDKITEPEQPAQRGDDIDIVSQPQVGGFKERWYWSPSFSRYFFHNRLKSAFRCVWANEIDRFACQVYRKHFGEGELFEGDIRTVEPSTIPEHELLTGGFPCQSFSIAGQRGGFADIRGTLFQEICRIARAKKSPYLLLENVKGLLSAPYTEDVQDWSEEDFNEDGDPTPNALKKHKSIPGTKGWVFLTILHTLWECGYDCQWQVINSRYQGIPQNRERVYIIGTLRAGGIRRPQVFPLGKTGEEFNEGDTAIANSLQSPGHSGGNVPMIVRPVLTPKRANKRQNGRRFKEDGDPSFTLTGQDHHGIEISNAVDQDGYLRTGARPRDENGKALLLPIGYRRIRRLTPLECERLQAFPDNWTEGISDSQRYKCTGNAVTVAVPEAIGRVLLEQIGSQYEKCECGDSRDSHENGEGECKICRWNNPIPNTEPCKKFRVSK